MLKNTNSLTLKQVFFFTHL